MGNGRGIWGETGLAVLWSCPACVTGVHFSGRGARKCDEHAGRRFLSPPPHHPPPPHVQRCLYRLSPQEMTATSRCITQGAVSGGVESPSPIPPPAGQKTQTRNSSPIKPVQKPFPLTNQGPKPQTPILWPVAPGTYHRWPWALDQPLPPTLSPSTRSPDPSSPSPVSTCIISSRASC